MRKPIAATLTAIASLVMTAGLVAGTASAANAAYAGPFYVYAPTGWYYDGEVSVMKKNSKPGNGWSGSQVDTCYLDDNPYSVPYADKTCAGGNYYARYSGNGEWYPICYYYQEFVGYNPC